MTRAITCKDHQTAIPAASVGSSSGLLKTPELFFAFFCLSNSGKTKEAAIQSAVHSCLNTNTRKVLKVRIYTGVCD